MRNRPARPREHARAQPDLGFTLVEMVMAIGITAFAFAAVAAMLLASLRVTAVQKARTQGNEVATQGIEDLQRLSYDDLVLCQEAPFSPSAPRPAGFADPSLVGCGGSPTKYEPCAGTPASGAVPSEEYWCPRNGVRYHARRFIAYDSTHTEKRLAVVVDWQDSAGPHFVSQQSSLRIPTKAVSVGAVPPLLDASQTQVPATIPLDATKKNSGTIFLQTRVSGLASTDTVIAVLTVLDSTGQPVQKSVALTSSDGVTWSTSTAPPAIPAGTFTFGEGHQYVLFTAIRESDGKVGSLVSSTATAVGDTSAEPSMTTPAIDRSDLKVTPTRNLDDTTPSFTVTTTTTNISPADSVALMFPTLTGVATVSMHTVGPVCVGIACTTNWAATVDQTNGYRFLLNTTQMFFVQATQVGAGGVYSFDAARTNAAAAGPVNIHL